MAIIKLVSYMMASPDNPREHHRKKDKLKVTNAQKGIDLKSESPCSRFKGIPYLYPQSRYGQRSSTKPEYKGLRVATPDN